MNKIKTKIIAYITLISIILMPTYVFADNTIDVLGTSSETIKDVSGTGSIGDIINKYEDYLKNTKDGTRLKKLLKERDGLKNKNISDDLKNEIINNAIFNASKRGLDSDSELNKINDKGLKERVLNSLKNSTKIKEDYRLIVNTNLGIDDLKNTLSFFDNLTINLLSNDLITGKNTYELIFPNKGKFARAMANYIEAGQIPSTLFDGIEIVQPVLLKQIGVSDYLSGETLTQTWGITKVGADKYQYSLSQKAKIKIGVIDTGIDYTHSELISNLDTSLSKNFVNTTLSANDDHGHGTHVAGIIGAGVNGKGIFGVDSNVSLVALKVLSRDGYGSSYGIVDAINYASVNGIKVINMSLGGSGTPTNNIICNAITNAKAKGTISVVAAGNENSDVSTKVPAGCSDAITVGAVDSTLTKASFSNYGTEVDVSAPGVNIYSTYKGNTYATMAGTSMATPFVAGMVGAILSSTGGTYDSVKSALISNGVAVNSSVNIGKFISMPNTMKALGIADDLSYINTGTTNTGTTNTGTTNTGTTNPPNTGSGITNSGSTNSGVVTPPVNILPTLSISSTKLSTNNYQIIASAKDVDGKIVGYNFFVNNLLTYSGTTNIYKLSITANTTIKVVIIDNSGRTANQSLSLTYEAPVIANKVPIINSSYRAYGKYYNLVTTSANDSDGYITNFSIYINNVLTYNYSNLRYKSLSLNMYTIKGKTYTIKTVAKDNSGGISEKTIIVK